MPPDATAAPALHLLLDTAADALAEVLAQRALDPVLRRCPPALQPGAKALALHALQEGGEEEHLVASRETGSGAYLRVAQQSRSRSRLY